MILLIVLFAFLFLLEAASVSAAQGIALTIAGVVAPIVAQLIKRWGGVAGRWALALALAVSAAVALVALYMAGEVHSFGDVVKNIAAVFGIATVVFRLFIEPPGASK